MQQQVDYPQMSDLPIDRLPSKNGHFPFATTGLDYVGPFPIILQGKQYQAYILLFTCLVIRAVHLEISLGLSTDSTLLCIRRFLPGEENHRKWFLIVGQVLWAPILS